MRAQTHISSQQLSMEQFTETHSPEKERLHSSPAVPAVDTTPEMKNVPMRRTPFSRFKRVQSNFKSPLQVSEVTKVGPAEGLAELQRRRDQLDAEIVQLEAEGYRETELEHHINKLHEYNDIKDIGQSLLGRIAALRGTTTRDLYSHFGLELDD